MIIARTDARAVAGFDEALARANAALAAGADMAFVEAPQTMEELAAVPKRVAGPCLLNVVRGGKTPEIDLRRAQEMGYRLAIVPGLLLKAVIGACDEMLAELKATHVHPVPRKDMTVREAFDRVGADEWDTLRTRFRDGARECARAAGSEQRGETDDGDGRQRRLPYEPVVDWAKLPPGWSFKEIGSVGVDKNDNVYVFNRGEHPMIVFDRDGNFLRSWGEGVFRARTACSWRRTTRSG